MATTSFSKAPQARDDSYSFLEDQLPSSGPVILDVMANDLGGAAKKLYSIDDGDKALTDLVNSDVTTVWETTKAGNQIRINAGKIEFQLGFDAQTLAEGEKYADSFVYAIKLGNGALSYATVNFNLVGQNDGATISAGVSTASAGLPTLTEDSGTYGASGTLTVSDVDTGQAKFQSVAPEALNGNYGVFSFDPETGVWSYTLDNDAAQELGQGVTETESLTVTSFDGTATETISVIVAGVNDAATFGGDAGGAVFEDGEGEAGGTLTVTDVDLDETGFKVVADGDLQGKYGEFTFDEASGEWTYTLDNDEAQALKGSETVTETLTVESLDGTEKTISVTVTGANDEAAISGAAIAGPLTEDSGAYRASGTLVVTDVDRGENQFQSVIEEVSNYGAFSFNPETGAWSYELNNALAQELGQGDEATESLTVTSLDGTATKTISVTVAGVNDAATFIGADSGAVVEDGNGVASGKLIVADVDLGEAAFGAVVSALKGAYGDFTFEATSGDWTYTLNNNKAQALKGSDTVTESLTVESLDGTRHEIEVTVQGADEAPPAGTPTTGGPDVVTPAPNSGSTGGNAPSNEGSIYWVKNDGSVLINGTKKTSIDNFTVSSDKLDFSAVDANSKTTGDQDFNLVSGSTVTAYSINWFEESGKGKNSTSHTIVQMDTDGVTNTIEFQVTLTGTTGLTAENFIL